MTDALGDLVQLVATSLIWSAVSAWVRDQPPPVQVGALALGAVAFLLVRSRRRSRRRGVAAR